MTQYQDASRAYKIAQKKMLDNDAFSQWLGIQILDIRPGFCKLHMEVTSQMTNGFGIAHGGICFALADSALAFAANAHGRQAKSVDTSIAHFHAVNIGDSLIATTEEQIIKHKLGVYTVNIYNQENKKVAFFKGTVYRSSQDWSI